MYCNLVKQDLKSILYLSAVKTFKPEMNVLAKTTRNLILIYELASFK